MNKQSFRAIHLGDLHFSRIPINPLLYSPKRILGVGNLIVGGRRKRFRTSMGHLLVERLEGLEHPPHAYLFSGDFSSTSLAGEFADARDLLEATVKKALHGAHVVPGNHDCYCGRERDAVTFKRELSATFHAETGVRFHQLTDGIGLLAINATTNNGLMGCHGAITPEITRQAREAIGAAGEKLEHLWILCHFPPEEPTEIVPHDRGCQLLYGDELLEYLGTLTCAKVWLHGHHHYRWLYTSPRVENLVYLNAGAPFLRHGRELPDLGYHELVVDGSEWRVRTHFVNEAGTQWLVADPDIPAPGKYLDLQKNMDQAVTF